MLKFVNQRTGEETETKLSKQELANEFAKLQGNDWLWFFICKITESSRDAPAANSVMQHIHCMFMFAKRRGLKNPRIRVGFETNRYTFYLSRRGTLCFKVAQRVDGTEKRYGEDEYVGCFVNGKILMSDRRLPTVTDNDFIKKLLEVDDIGEFLANRSRDLGQCCYCGLPLDDPKSKYMGYGKICAQRWGLPWGKEDYSEVAPSFSWMITHNPLVKNVMEEIYTNPDDPTNETRWGIMSDYLLEQGVIQKCL